MSSLFSSIIVPVFNGEDCIKSCLEALNNQTVQRSDYEILVINDGSTDDTVSLAEPLCDQIISIENSGPAVARNRGADAARAPVLLFTDADCIPASNWIETMMKPFENLEVAGAKGAYFTRQREIVAQFVQAEYESKYTYMQQFDFIDFIDTYSAGFRKDIFQDLGGFDTQFPGASVEDQEFSFRVSEAGHKMVFVPEARVFHRHAWTLRGYIKKKFNIGFWKVLVLRLHPSKAVKDTHTPQTLKVQLPLALLLTLSVVLSPWLGWIPFLVTVILFMATGYRETSQCLKNRFWIASIGSPFIMLCRSISLGAGLLWGLSLKNHIKKT